MRLFRAILRCDKIAVAALTAAIVALSLQCADARGRIFSPRVYPRTFSAPSLKHVRPTTPADRAIVLQENIKQLSEIFPEDRLRELAEKNNGIKEFLETKGSAAALLDLKYPDIGLPKVQVVEFTPAMLSTIRTLSVLTPEPNVFTKRLAILPSRLERTAVYNFLPTNDAEFRTVFGKDASFIDRDDIATANEYFMQNSKTAKFEVRTPGKEISIFDKGDPKPDIYIFVGHNEGGHLVSPQGEKIDIRELSKNCAVHVVVCVFVSCKTQRDIYGGASLGIKSFISIRESINILSEVSEVVQSDLSKSVKFWTMARALENEKSEIVRVRVVEAFGSLIILALLSDDTDLEMGFK